MSVDLLHVAPLLFPADSERLSYAGYITIGEQNFYIKIILPSNRDMRNVRIDCDQKLHNILRDYKELINKKIAICHDLSSMIIELKSVLNSILTAQTPPTLSPPSYYTRLVSEIKEIGWERVSHVDVTTCQDLEITIKDKGNRQHTLSIHIPNKYPNDVPVCNVLLPLPFQPNWSPSNTLNTLVKQFENLLENYQLFWDTLDELDQNTWVLEPNSPSFASNYRRIVIGTYLSIQIKIDPLSPWSFPEYILLGPTNEVASLKKSLCTLGRQWNDKSSILTNLQSVLGLDFPSPVSSKKENWVIECGICYTHEHLETEKAPDITCNNERCVQVYHHSCLYEWLTNLPTTRKSFNKLLGNCIYCDERIVMDFNG